MLFNNKLTIQFSSTACEEDWLLALCLRLLSKWRMSCNCVTVAQPVTVECNISSSLRGTCDTASDTTDYASNSDTTIDSNSDTTDDTTNHCCDTWCNIDSSNWLARRDISHYTFTIVAVGNLHNRANSEEMRKASCHQ